MSESRDLQVRLGFGDYYILINAESVSYAPDALHDMILQAVVAFREGYAVVRADMQPDDEDEDAAAGDEPE